MLFPIHNFFPQESSSRGDREGVTSGTSRIAVPLGSSPTVSFPWRPGGSRTLEVEKEMSHEHIPPWETRDIFIKGSRIT
ncbi:hypothetical protein TNCT_32431 [Trichonephila clavata]|uniref:Uncharacterized protein n=1 Tax=Trichonephila clavata TaxID=2740835 RepID=A0A8X6I3P6_TRICU|nr:hypothetical protein TNCT_32431 [Trichonephila clavata]